MPGLIGFVGKNRRPHAMSSAALALQHLSEYCNRQSTPFQDFSIAQIWRNPKETSGSWHNDGASGVSTFVNGTVIVPGDQPRQLNAQDVLAAYLNKSLAPESYDGSFVICIGDERSRKVIIFNDRLGTLPCYYYSNSISFCFAPEAKAIFKLNGEIPG